MMNELPPELLNNIIERLEKKCWSSLRRVSRYYNLAVVPLYFREIRIFLSQQDLQRGDNIVLAGDVQCWRVILQDKVSHVRTLEILDRQYSQFPPWSLQEAHFDAGALPSAAQIGCPQLFELIQELDRLSEVKFMHNNSCTLALFKALKRGCIEHIQVPNLCDGSLGLWNLELEMPLSNLRRIHVHLPPRMDVWQWCITTLISVAPNLQHVSLQRGAACFESIIPLSSLLPTRNVTLLSTLLSLRISGFGGSNHVDSSSFLELWTKMTDLTKLQVLGIRGQSLSTGQFLRLTGNCTFPALKELDLYVDDDDDVVRNERCDIGVVSFLNSLPALEKIILSGNITSAHLEVILRRHGATLSKLTLQPWASNNDRALKMARPEIEQIGSQCTKLEDLSICLEYPGYARKGQGLIKALRQLHSIRRLSLFIDCMTRRLQHTKGLTRQFRRCDIDHTSVRDLYSRLHASSTKGCRKLEKLFVCTFPGHHQQPRSDDGRIMDIFLNLSRAFVCSRGDYTEEVGVRKDREARLEELLQKSDLAATLQESRATQGQRPRIFEC